MAASEDDDDGAAAVVHVQRVYLTANTCLLYRELPPTRDSDDATLSTGRESAIRDKVQVDACITGRGGGAEGLERCTGSRRRVQSFCIPY